MGKGPGLYSGIGKKARDLLYNDYDTDLKFTSSFPKFALSSATMEKGKYFGILSTQSKDTNISTDIKLKLGTYSNILAATTVECVALPGFKTIISWNISDYRSNKIKLQYLNDYAGITGSIGLTRNPILNFSGVLGDENASLGLDVSYDTKTASFTNCNAGISFCYADLTSSLTLKNRGNILSASCYHRVAYNHALAYPKRTAVGAEVAHKFSTNEKSIAIGAQFALSPATTLKARINNFAKPSAVIRTKWSRKSIVTISGEVDKSPKFGLAFAVIC